MGRAPGQGEQRRHARRQGDGRDDADQGGDGLLAQAAVDPGAWRSPAASPSSCRTAPARDSRRCSTRAISCSALPRRARSLVGVRPESAGGRAAAARQSSIGSRRARWVCPSPTSTRRSRSPSAAPMRTTSPAMAASCACCCRPTRRSRMTPEDILDLQGAHRRWARWFRSDRFTTVRVDGRPAAAAALQRLSGDDHLRLSRPRPLHRRGDGRDGAAGGSSCRRASASNGPASATRSSKPRARSVRCWACRWSSCSCCSPRFTKAGRCPLAVLLVVPLGVLGAVLFSMFRGLVGGRLFQCRPDHDHRPGGEERDPDRRIRHRRGGGRQDALEATMEAVKLRLRPIIMTVARLHPRHGAAGDRERGRRGQPHRGGHRASMGGMITATLARHLLHSAVLSVGAQLRVAQAAACAERKSA